MKNIDITKLRFAQYARKSSEAKERQELSIPDQNAECDKITHRLGLNIVQGLEESKTAFKPDKRQIFDQMLKDIRTGRINAILVWKENRLARNPKESGIIVQLLQDRVLECIYVVSSNTIITPDSDHMISQIHFMMANQFSRNLSSDVRRGLEYKAKRGEYPRPAPLGFETYGEVRKRNIRPSKEASPQIRQLFELGATGEYSLTGLHKYADMQGFRTRRGKGISKSHLHSILTNPVYYGQFYHNGELYDGDYEPIIGKSLFDQVQQALKSRTKPINTKWQHPFNRLLVCGHCKCMITTTIKRKFYKGTNRWATYIYHNCTKRKGSCPQISIKSSDLDSQLLDYIQRVSIDEELWALGIKLLKERHKSFSQDNENSQKTHHTRLERLRERRHNLITMAADGQLEKEEFLTLKKVCMDEEAQVKALIDDNKSSSENWLELAESFLDTAFQARKIMESDDYVAKRKLVLSVGQNLILKDGKVDLTFQKPFDLLLKPELRTNVLPSKDSNPDSSVQSAESYH